jgi:pimeloyl-ACP methyl ester carboxylesterase
MFDPLSLVSNSRFHRRVTFDTACGSLTVSFAEIGSVTGPTLLFLPGMFASRYSCFHLHALAESAGLRLLVVDRPGMGASTDVPLNQRVTSWVDLVPRLLAHLDIARVNLVSHSAGTVFLLNTLAQCRELVNPEVFLLGD